MPRTEARELAIELLKRFPEASNKSLARRLQKDLKETISLESARYMIRVAAGAAGDKQRKYRDVDKPLKKAGELPALPKMPKSQETGWRPYKLGSNINVAILSDIHTPYHSEAALQAAVNYCKRRKPDVLLLNGDTIDFYSISRWETRPRQRDLPGELAAARAMVRWLRSNFKNARIVWKDGNHDERWKKWLWRSAAEISEEPEMTLVKWLKLNELDIEYVTDQRPIMAGKLPILHGHELGKAGVANPVNPARGAFLRTHHTVLIGHSHQSSNHTDTNMWHSETAVWSTGCLCGLTPDYAKLNRWNHGFAFVEVDRDGSFKVDNLRVSRNGHVR